MLTFDVAESLAKMDITSEPSPPPVLAEVQDLVAVSSQLSDSISGETIQLQDELIRTQSPVQVHIVRYYRFRQSHDDPLSFSTTLYIRKPYDGVYFCCLYVYI